MTARCSSARIGDIPSGCQTAAALMLARAVLSRQRSNPISPSIVHSLVSIPFIPSLSIHPPLLSTSRLPGGALVRRARAGRGPRRCARMSRHLRQLGWPGVRRLSLCRWLTVMASGRRGCTWRPAGQAEADAGRLPASAARQRRLASSAVGLEPPATLIRSMSGSSTPRCQVRTHADQRRAETRRPPSMPPGCSAGTAIR